MGGVWLVGRGVNLLFLNIKQTLLYSVSTLQRFAMLSVDMIIIGCNLHCYRIIFTKFNPINFKWRIG
jgi:hypothetical protein